MTSPLHTVIDRCNGLLDRVQSIALLATRLVLGEAFVLTGSGKWRHFEGTVGFFTDLGIPAPTANAAFVASVELVGGLCLILGLGTRFAALLLSSTMVVALATADRGAFFDALLLRSDQGLTGVVPLVYLVLLCWLIGSGSGRLSLDALLRRRSARRQAMQPMGVTS